MEHDFKFGDQVEFACDGDFDRYKGSTNPDLYDLGTVVSDGVYLDIKWESDGEVSSPSLFSIRKLVVTNTRPHAELIKAWADGAEIEYRCPDMECWYPAKTPTWDPKTEYRIKPNEIKLVAFINEQGSLRWIREELFASVNCSYIRVPSEDKTVTIEVTTK